MSQNVDVVVVGSINYDLFSYTPRLPAPGETIDGHSFMTGFGGKGANQAVMGSKLGGHVAMVGKIGNDAFGREYSEYFDSVGVNVSKVGVEEDVATAVATVNVDDSGENCIIIIKGANNRVTPEYVEEARPLIKSSKVLVCQNEIPLESTIAALKIAKEEGKTTIFNPAPALDKLPDECFELSDIICPNETEACIIAGKSVETSEGASDAAKALLEKGAKTVVMTLGARGALVATSAEDIEIVEGVTLEKSQVVDTTGAGDSFIGSLSFFLARGLELKEAVRRACIVASHSVQKKGAQSSYPVASDLPAELIPVSSATPEAAAKE